MWPDANGLQFREEYIWSLFVDDYSRSCVVYFMAHKSDTFAMFQEFHAKVTGESGERIGVLKTDGGGGYRSRRFAEYLRRHQIAHEVTIPDSRALYSSIYSRMLSSITCELSKDTLCMLRVPMMLLSLNKPSFDTVRHLPSLLTALLPRTLLVFC